MISIKELKSIKKQEKDTLRTVVLTYYQNNPILWNVKLKEYSNRAKRATLLEYLSEEIQCDGNNHYNNAIDTYY